MTFNTKRFWNWEFKMTKMFTYILFIKDMLYTLYFMNERQMLEDIYDKVCLYL